MMTNNKPPTWLCPLCDYVVPYGKTCPNRKDLSNCKLGNKNVNYWIYLNKETNDTKGIGISEISNE